MKKFIVRRYDMVSNEVVETDMNELYKNGYYPKEIKLSHYQNFVDATIIFEDDSNA